MNTTIISALIEYPSVILYHFILEPFLSAALAYYLVWLIMRPKDEREKGSFFFWHSCGLAATVISSSIFRIIAMATFAGYSAYDPPAEGGVLGFYIFIVPALFAAGYIALFRFFRISVNQTESGKQGLWNSFLNGFNPLHSKTRTTRRLSISLLSISLLAWVSWIGVESDGFSGMKPLGWFLFFGAPLVTYITLLIVLPVLSKAPMDIRFMISASLIWVFMVGAWGYIWQWDDELSFERYMALFALPPIGICLAFLLWKWSRVRQNG